MSLKISLENNRRPDPSNLTDEDLYNVINHYDKDWLTNNPNHERYQVIEHIFYLWSNHNLLDKYHEPIDCLICYDKLSQGNNLSFECGHQFHSDCIIKFIIIKTSEKSIRDFADDKISDIKLNFNCPQCCNLICSHEINKSKFVNQYENEEDSR